MTANYLQKRVDLQEKRFENEAAIKALKQKEDMLHEIDQQGKKVFNHLSSQWVTDAEVIRTLDTSRVEHNDHMRQMHHQFAAEKDELLKDKKSLIDEEEELHDLKHAALEEETKWD